MDRYTEQELKDLYFDVLDFFNGALDSGITRDNTVLAFLSRITDWMSMSNFARGIFRRT